jgi:hypothetical protein
MADLDVQSGKRENGKRGRREDGKRGKGDGWLGGHEDLEYVIIKN